jgi:hypothetical protein
MALKRKISKDTYDKLSDVLKTEYVEKDGSYVLDVDGDDGFEAIKAEKQKEATKRREAEAKLREAEEALEELKTGNARKNGDVAAIEKSWKDKLEAKETEFTGKMSKRQAQIDRLMRDSTAAAIAAEISTVPGVMKRAVLDRLTIEYDSNDEPTLRILDEAGKPSAKTVDDLKTEFRTNKEYAPIIKASAGSGGGSAGGGASNRLPNSVAGGAGTPDKSTNLASLSPKDLAARIAASKQTT